MEREGGRERGRGREREGDGKRGREGGLDLFTNASRTSTREHNVHFPGAVGAKHILIVENCPKLRAHLVQGLGCRFWGVRFRSIGL
jgi:hypothetical protein